MKILSIPFLFCLAFIVLVETAQSAQQQQDSSQPSSRKAYIDESTGELTSTPSADTKLSEEAAAAVATPQAQEREIEYITHPDGTVEGRLDGHFQSELTVTLGCDGSLTKAHSNEDLEVSNSKSLESCEESE